MSATTGVGLDALLHAAISARAIRPDVPLAMATLVDVEGSSFRQPGARLLIDAEARCLAGAVSGGCLEADVAARAAAVCANGRAEYLVYDLRDDLHAIWGFDAACDGVAHILLEPLHDTTWLEDAVRVRRARHSAAIVTVVPRSPSAEGATRAADDSKSPASTDAVSTTRETRNSQPRTLGVVQHIDDRVAWQHAIEPAVRAANTTHRSTLLPATIDNVPCRVFADPVLPPVALHVIGAGRGAESFARIGTAMGWQVTVVDHRPALLEALSLPSDVIVRHARPEQADTLVADAASAVALMTHIFEIDRAWLDALLPRGHGYIGVLGSRQRAQRLLDTVSATSLTPLHAPIGLDIGGESPESIALATIAEIHAVMYARPGGPLRERRSPIHERTPVPVSTLPHAITPSTCRSPE